MTIVEFFKWINEAFRLTNQMLNENPLLLGFIAIIGLIVALLHLAKYLSNELCEASQIGHKKSYEDSMSHYEGKEAVQLDLRSGVSMDDLLESDGEIPDKFLRGRQ